MQFIHSGLNPCFLGLLPTLQHEAAFAMTTQNTLKIYVEHNPKMAVKDLNPKVIISVGYKYQTAITKKSKMNKEVRAGKMTLAAHTCWRKKRKFYSKFCGENI